MTEWGTPIAVNGRRPAWLADGEVVLNPARPDAPWTANPIQDWRGVPSIQIRSDHPHYSRKGARMTPPEPQTPDVVEGEAIGPFHVSRSSDGTREWYSARDPASGCSIPGKSRDDAYALADTLNAACRTFASATVSRPTEQPAIVGGVDREGFSAWLRRYVGEQNANIMRFGVDELKIAYNAGRSDGAMTVLALTARPSAPAEVEAMREAAAKVCDHTREIIGAATGSSIAAALSEAKDRIRALPLPTTPAPVEPGSEREAAFALGDRVEKVSGSSWRGIVVGTYSTTLTPEGYAVESEREPGSVQIYPAKALARPAADDAK